MMWQVKLITSGNGIYKSRDARTGRLSWIHFRDKCLCILMFYIEVYLLLRLPQECMSLKHCEIVF